MPSFNVQRALGAGYEPREILRYLAGRGYQSPYQGSDEDIIRQHMAAQQRPLLPYEYADPAQDPRLTYSPTPPPIAAPPTLQGLSGPPSSQPGNVPQTGEQRRMSPGEIEALFSEQGIQPALPPLSLMDMAMLAASGPEQDAGIPLTALAAVRYKKPGVSALAREAAEAYHARPVNDPLPVALPGQDTRGLGRQYHGTSKPVAALDEFSYNPLNIYGQGFYTTDAMDVARGYTKKGKGTSPTIYRVSEQVPQKLYDMDAPLGKEAAKAIEPVRDTFVGDILESEQPKTMRELYDEVRAWSRGEGMSADEVQELFDSIGYNLEQQGYTGMTHKGGAHTGTKPHRVNIYFNPPTNIKVDTLRGMTSLLDLARKRK